MDNEIKTLITEGNKTVEALRNAVEAKADAGTVARIEADLAKTLEAKAALEARLVAVENAAARPGAMKGNEAADEYKSAFINAVRKPADSNAKSALDSLSKKAVEVSSGFGIAVPSEIASEVNRLAVDFSPIRQIAKVVTVGSADYKEILDNANAGFEWVGETTTRAVTDAPTISEIVPVWGEMSAVAEISQTALEDLMFNAEAWLVASLAEKFSQGEGAAFVAGNGTNKPRGFLNGTTVSTVASGAAAGFGTNAYDNIIDLMFAVKGAYRQNGSFVMNSATLAALTKVKTTDGAYIYQPAIAAGLSDTILGKRIVLAEDMPSVAAGAKPVVFGDFQRGYLIADRVGFGVLLDPYSRTGYLQVKARKRVAGIVADANALKALEIKV